MSDATTVRLPARIKRRIAPLARAAGKSPHAWMVDALVAQVEQAERRQGFAAGALESRAAVSAGEPVYAADDVLAWLHARATGQKARRPVARAAPVTTRWCSRWAQAGVEPPSTCLPTQAPQEATEPVERITGAVRVSTCSGDASKRACARW